MTSWMNSKTPPVKWCENKPTECKCNNEQCPIKKDETKNNKRDTKRTRSS